MRDPAEVIALIAGSAGGPSTLAVEARATHYGAAGVIKGKLAAVVRRPGAIRFTALSPTDDVVSVMATDGDRFTAFERGADVCYIGRACPENVGRFVPVAMETDQLAGALSGRPPLIAHGAETLTWDRRVGAYRLELEGQGGLLQRVWARHPAGEVVRAQLLRDGQVTVDLTYDDHRVVDGHRLPHRVDVKLARGDTDLRLVYRTVDVDLPLEDAAFALECPRGTRVEPLPCPDEAPP